MTEGVACGDDDFYSSHPGEYAVFIRDLPISLASLKWLYKEIPAQEHEGMTEGVACGDDEVTNLSDAVGSSVGLIWRTASPRVHEPYHSLRCDQMHSVILRYPTTPFLQGGCLPATF